MITDTRTSEDTAVSERANILAQVQHAKGRTRVEDLERRYNAAQAAMLTLQRECTDLVDKVDKASAEYQDAALESEQAKQAFDMFKAQAQHFFNQGKSVCHVVSNIHSVLQCLFVIPSSSP
jgi:chromosome segregation ATPase